MVHHIAGGHSERDLRSDEPDPINPGVQRRINQLQSRPDKRRPQEWGNKTAPEISAARWKHRQQHSEEQTDENEYPSCGDKADNKTCTVEGGQLREVGSSQGGYSGCGQQVNRIPDAAVCNDTIHTGNNRHRNAAGNTALNTRRVRMNCRWNTNPVV